MLQISPWQWEVWDRVGPSEAPAACAASVGVGNARANVAILSLGAVDEKPTVLEAENTILRAALAFLRAGGKEKRPPLRDRAKYARERRAELRARKDVAYAAEGIV
jgi:hypothetical protein